MLKEYIWRGTTWQFEESEAPEGAVLVEKAKKPAAKKAAPRNKARKTETKEA